MALIGRRKNREVDITEEELEKLEGFREDERIATTQQLQDKVYQDSVKDIKAPIHGTLRLPEKPVNAL